MNHPKFLEAVKLMHHIARVTRAATTLDNGHAGACFCLARETDGVPSFQWIVGEPEISRARELYEQAHEQLNRLLRNPEHGTSFQSRDHGSKRFGGSVRFGQYVLSCAGFSEPFRTAAVLKVGLLMGMIDSWQASEIARATDCAEQYKQLYDLVGSDQY